jgi:hypothetical protein
VTSLALVPSIEERRTCRKCGTDKALSEFRVYKNGKRRWSCNPCLNTAIEEWRRKKSSPESKDRRRAQHRAHSKGFYGRHPDRSKAYSKAWQERNPDKYRAVLRDSHLKTNFGLERGEYVRMLARQNGVCAICRRPETVMLHGKIKRLAVDHCHTTNVVRGLLCACCNLAIGYAGDDALRLRAAANYLERR